jgi:rRNA processing protein Gar1
MNLGVLLGTSPQHIILRCHEWDESKGIPAIDEPVYDTNKQLIGRIADIFGPAKKPFISIALARSTGMKLEDFAEKKGATFYTLPDAKKKSEFKKYRPPSGSPRPARPSMSGRSTKPTKYVNPKKSTLTSPFHKKKRNNP